MAKNICKVMSILTLLAVTFGNILYAAPLVSGAPTSGAPTSGLTNSGSNNMWLIIGICIAVVVIAVIGLLIKYLRKNKK